MTVYLASVVIHSPGVPVSENRSFFTSLKGAANYLGLGYSTIRAKVDRDEGVIYGEGWSLIWGELNRIKK